MRWKARFDCKKRNMRAKQREEKAKRRRQVSYVSLIWVLVLLIGKKHLCHKEVSKKSKVGDSDGTKN